MSQETTFSATVLPEYYRSDYVKRLQNIEKGRLRQKSSYSLKSSTEGMKPSTVEFQSRDKNTSSYIVIDRKLTSLSS
jgi:hypothetical protein